MTTPTTKRQTQRWSNEMHQICTCG